MSSEGTIQNHLDLCDSVHALLIEENRALKKTQSLPDAEILGRKQKLLPLLEESLNGLKGMQPELVSPFDNTKELIKKAQDKLLQILYLDKENEQLMLKYSLAENAAKLFRSTSPAEAKKIYNETIGGSTEEG